MELIERDMFLSLLQKQFTTVAAGEGHCFFVSGEAGIGKTSLVKAFCKQQKEDANIYQGACDALFTPRPLAPLYDIIWQVNKDLWPNSQTIQERNELFIAFFRELSARKEMTLIVFEDIHWADEATLDFIKFFARRITQLRCLFILTYRDDEIHAHHPLRNVLGQLPPDCFTRLQLTPLSREAVDKLALQKGYSGEDVYSISSGNPFYVNEILASYSKGVPDSIKDTVLSAYNRQEEKTRQIWEILSVIPDSFEIRYLERLEPQYAAALERCIESRILLMKDGLISFKHELFRRTIETSLSPLRRVMLNKRILELFRESFEQDQQIERIIHHAKNANEYDIIVHYAPLAARQAAAVGAHIEASRLYLSAIEYYQGKDKELLIQFYQSYAYECYLTNQIKEAIIYTRRALKLWQEKNDREKIGNCLRFLSRLWWFDGNRKNAEDFARQAIAILENQPSSSAKAMAYSNMSQLKMLSDEGEESIHWGEKAIVIAKELGDDEILSHALNNVGSVKMNFQSTYQQGVAFLQQSLDIALKDSYHEHASRAYTNIASRGVKMRNYSLAWKALEEGIAYCEERDLDSWTTYMLSLKARINLEISNWKDAYAIADNLLENEDQPTVVKIGALVILAKIKMRRGDSEAYELLLEAKEKAFETMEQQRILPVSVALLEYEWITGKELLDAADIDRIIVMITGPGNEPEKSEFAFWLKKARNIKLTIPDNFEGYQPGGIVSIPKKAIFWEKMGCLYEQALVLSEGTDENKREAIKIIQGLVATAVFEKMKMEMRGSGIRSIPRGARKSTQSNAALLTTRELDVLGLLRENLQNKEIASRLFISAKTVDHHISSILFKLDVNSRSKAVNDAMRLGYIK
jgi:DNA-binding CsgD family transcriptional regulator